MKNSVTILLFTLLVVGCKRNQDNSNRSEVPDSFNLSAVINKKMDSINSISQLVIENPVNQLNHQKNDSITRAIAAYTEGIINALIDSYGKTHTDTIFSVLKQLDNSGYIPFELYEKLNEEDFSSEIGKRALADYQDYTKSKADETNSLKLIDLLGEALSVHRIIENDTIMLKDLLTKHKGYKVLDFWATWCAPCRSFNKKFQKDYEFYKDKGIAFYGIGIKIDSENEKDKFLTAVKNDNTPWKQFIDLDDHIYKLFNTNTVPYQVLLDVDNQIIKILSHDINRELDDVLKTSKQKKE